MNVRRGLASLAVGVLAAGAASAGAARAADPSNDAFWDTPPVQWGLLQVGAPAAWAASTGAGITVGVVDSGIEATHDDLAGKIDAGANCVGSNGNEAACAPGGDTDVVGHGTHVAGIIAATTNNGIGVASMAPDARLVSAQAVGRDGSGSDADVGAAIRWVVDHGASVVNLSLGAEGTSRVAFGPGFSSAVEYAWSHGAIPVVAAGNSAQTPNFGNLHIIVVAATTPAGQFAPYSNHLDLARWGVAAPGGASDGNPFDDIVSTYVHNSYATIAGTSMAAAFVSGEVALVRAKGYSRDDTVQRVTTNTVACGGCGSGRIDAAAALGAGAAPPPSLPPGGGGSGSAAPGSATVIPPKARAASGAGTPTRATPPRTAPPTTAAATTTSTVPPPATPPAGPLEAALGGPSPGEVRVNNTPSGGQSSSSRLLPIGLALTSLLGVGGALAFGAWRRGFGGT